MPSTGLRGPFKLDNDTIDKEVTTKSAGAYALGYLDEERAFVPKYVGRSDDDVNKRLKDWVGKYAYFKFEYYGSPKAAFEKECNLYHDWKDQIDNKTHPDRPDGSDWQCPRCDAFKEQ
jgi:hypothetical protein